MAEAVARGSLVLSLDATQLNKGLDKAKKDAGKAGSEIAKTFKDSSKEKIGELAGGGSIVGMGAKAGLIGAGIAAVAFAGKELYEGLIVQSKAYGRELEANERAVSKWADNAREKFDAVTESLTEFSSVAGTTEGLKANELALAKMQAQLRAATQAKEDQLEVEKSYDSKWSSARNFELWMSSKLEDTAKTEANNTKTKTALVDEMTKKVEAQSKAYAKLRNPLTNPAALQALKDFKLAQEDAIAAITEERDADEQSIVTMQRKLNFNAQQLAQMRELVQMKRQAQANKSADDFIKQLTEDVGEYYGILKRTSDEVQRDELIKAGADKKQIERIQKLIDAKKKLNQQYTPLQALERGTAAEISFQNKDRFDAAKRAEAKIDQDLMRQQINILQRIAVGIAGLNMDSPQI